METQKKRIFYPNNYTPSILNSYSYYKNNTILKKQTDNYHRITPSYSGNPNLINNKRNVYPPNNFYYMNKYNSSNSFELNLPKKNNNSNNNKANDFTSLNSTSSFSSYANSKHYFSPIITKSTNNQSQSPTLLTPYIQNTPKFNISPKNFNRNYSSPYININRSHDFPKKKTLILDLDETLVHSGFNPFTRKSDVTLNINVDGRNHVINVLKRPYVDEFLKEMSEIFEIIVFTASISEYASALLDKLDRNHYFSKRLYRQDCIFNKGLYIKDLKIIGKDLKDLIIIDNNPVSYAVNEDNGIPILTWYDDLNDKELLKLIPLLKYLSNVDDVRPIIRLIVNRRTNEVDYNVVNSIINDKNYENDIYKNNLNNNNNNLSNEFYRSKYNNENIDRNRNVNPNDNIYNKFLTNDNYYKYNNTIDSFSNMSYNEIQNEGHLNNNSNYNNDLNENNDTNKRFNENIQNINREKDYLNRDYRNRDYYSNNNIYLVPYKPYAGYNKNPNENNNEDINKVNNNDKRLRNRRSYIPIINETNSYYTNDSLMNKYNNIYNKEEDFNNKNKENDELRMNYNYNNRSSSKIFSYFKKDNNIKVNNFIENNDKINEKPRQIESNERLNDYYLQSYKKHLLKSRTRANSHNYKHFDKSIIMTDEMNESNSMIRTNENNENNKYIKSINDYKELNNFYKNKNSYINAHQNEFNNINNQNINKKQITENEQKYIDREEKLEEINENIMKRANIFYEAHKNIYSYNNYFNNKDNNINNNIRNYQDKKDVINKEIYRNVNDYLLNKSNDNLNKTFSHEKNYLTNNINNITPNRLFNYREKYNINQYYIDIEPKNEGNIKYIHSNNNLDSNYYARRRTDTEIQINKIKSFIRYKDNGNDNIKNKINDTNTSIILNERNYNTNINQFNTNNDINKFNEKHYKYLNELNNNENRNIPISFINKYNYSYKNIQRNLNQLTPIRKNDNDLAINNYNFYRVSNDVNKNKMKPLDNDYNDKNEKDIKTLNRSASYFHPKSIIKSYSSTKNKKKKNEKENNINAYRFYRNNNQYKNEANKKMNEKNNNLKVNLFPNKKSNILKNKFLYNYNNNEFE